MIERVQASILKIVDAPGPEEAPLPPISLPTVDEPQPEIVAEEESTGPYADLYPRVNPLKAKEVFDSPEGFGLWNIFMAGEAIKHLREFKRRDQAQFDIVQNKIKALSGGHFSPDNHKRLVGGDKGIHIYEAKMTGDLRLVYRIDLQTDEELKVGVECMAFCSPG